MWLHGSVSGLEWWKPRAPVLSRGCDGFRRAPSAGANEFSAAGVAGGLGGGSASCLNDPPWFCEPFAARASLCCALWTAKLVGTTKNWRGETSQKKKVLIVL